MAFDINSFVNGWDILIAILALLLGFAFYDFLKIKLDEEPRTKPQEIMIFVRDTFIFLLMIMPIAWFMDFTITGEVTEGNFLLDYWLPLGIFLIVFSYMALWAYKISKFKKLIKLPKFLRRPKGLIPPKTGV